MTTTPIDAPALADDTPPAPEVATAKPARASVQPVLEKLFELYPHLFGGNFMPLKLGIFQELLAAHPEHFERSTLKAALGQHTRSGRYLHSVAAGNPRYDLQGVAVEPVTPEHIYLAMLELFRRRQGRTQEDLRPKFRWQLMAAFEASGLSRQDYLTRVQSNAAGANELLEEAFAERDVYLAKQEALVRAFEASGKSLEEFADMYGLDPREVHQAVERQA